jgi:hypothetical protein
VRQHPAADRGIKRGTAVEKWHNLFRFNTHESLGGNH